MSIDFFKAVCRDETSEKKFGLYDAEDSTPAIITLTDEHLWNAVVINESGKTINFTAIDNCIDVLNENGETDSRCDCMLTFNSTLMFVELKNKRGSWQAEGLSQIENIAKIMIAENPDYYYSFKKRKAIVANRRHQFPAFHFLNAEQRQFFSSKYKMRIQFNAEIVI